MEDDEVELAKESRRDARLRLDRQLKYMEENHPGPHDRVTIARYCGCFENSIQQIQDGAIMKIFKALIPHIDELEKHAKG